jgi:hypothetical protein
MMTDVPTIISILGKMLLFSCHWLGHLACEFFQAIDMATYKGYRSLYEDQ